jgi:hypothetical protein
MKNYNMTELHTNICVCKNVVKQESINASGDSLFKTIHLSRKTGFLVTLSAENNFL